MDLYEWAAKAMPWVGTELLLDCFELAIELREIYENEQTELAINAKKLREHLISKLESFDLKLPFQTTVTLLANRVSGVKLGKKSGLVIAVNGMSGKLSSPRLNRQFQSGWCPGHRR